MITAIANDLAPQIRPKYIVAIEERVYEVNGDTEGYLEIRVVETEEVITIIEVLSPKNKQVGVGRLQYETKRLQILGNATHLVEIDLLRQVNPRPMLGKIPTHYRIVISQSETRPNAKLYGFNLQDQIPEFLVPLRDGEAEPRIKLNLLLSEIYDQGGYDLRINYRRPPIPNLSESDTAWVNELLHQQGLK